MPITEAYNPAELTSDLEQVSANVPPEAVAEWTDEQQEAAHVWAKEIYKAANNQLHDTELVKGKNIPAHIRGWLPTSAQFDPVESARGTEPEEGEAAGSNGQLDKPRRFPCHFGRLSVGTTTCRLPIKIATGCLSTQDARELLCERRLDVRIKTGDEQKQFEGMEDEDAGDLEGIGDTKGLSISGGKYGSGLTFNRNDIPLDDLVPFAERDGELFIRGVSEIPKADKPVKGTETVGRPPEADSTDDANWGTGPVADLMAHGITEKKSGAIADALRKHGFPLARVRDLRDWIGSNEYWHKDIEGVGPSYVDKITDALMAYQQANPVQEDEDDDDGDGTILDAEEEDD